MKYLKRDVITTWNCEKFDTIQYLRLKKEKKKHLKKRKMHSFSFFIEQLVSCRVHKINTFIMAFNSTKNVFISSESPFSCFTKTTTTKNDEFIIWRCLCYSLLHFSHSRGHVIVMFMFIGIKVSVRRPKRRCT